jgi:hypothetical protein
VSSVIFLGEKLMTAKRIKAPYFTQELNDEDVLWRYFDLKGFLYLVAMKSIYFNRVDKFEDANEGVDLRLLMERKLRSNSISKKIIELGNLVLTDRIAQNQVINQKKYFVSCWHQNEEESPMMWGIYSNNEGIVLKIKYKDLKNLFKIAYINWTNPEDFDLSVEKIQYINFLDLQSKPKEEIEKLNKFGLFKDIGYRYENEVRIVAKSKEELSYNDQEITSLDIFLKNTKFEKITGVFHPKSEEWFQRSIVEIVKKLNIKLELQKSLLEYR